ncbi:TIR domain-containing protein [Vibrio cyclitrophicus]
MKRTIFYSWQSDLRNNANRGFIETALEQAVKKLINDDSFQMVPVIDRDTNGLIGSPDIAHSIFLKIEQADIFLCDVSIINDFSSGQRPVPNPNVLLELGYAIGKLGWERVIMVMNTHYGSIESLPFDLRARTILSYCQDPDADDKSKQRKILASKLTQSVEAILSFYEATDKSTSEKLDVAQQSSEHGKDRQLVSAEQQLDILLKIPSSADRGKALMTQVEKFKGNGEFKGALLFAERIPSSVDRGKALALIADELINAKQISLASTVIERIPSSSTRNKYLLSLAEQM